MNIFLEFYCFKQFPHKEKHFFLCFLASKENQILYQGPEPLLGHNLGLVSAGVLKKAFCFFLRYFSALLCCQNFNEFLLGLQTSVTFTENRKKVGSACQQPHHQNSKWRVIYIDHFPSRGWVHETNGFGCWKGKSSKMTP